MGKTKKSETLTPGCVVFVELKEHSTPELDVVLSPDGGNVTVRLRNQLLTTSVGICTPITKEPQSQSKTNAQSRNNMRIGELITHFIRLDLESTNVVKRIQKLQEDLGHIEGIGSPMKASSFHITLTVLSVKEGEIEHVMARTQKAIERILDLLKEKQGFMLACGGAGFGDYGSFWLSISLGLELCCILREYLEWFIADARFTIHLTIIKQNSMSDEARFQLED